MSQEPDEPLKLAPAIEKIAVDLARVFRLIHRRSPSSAVTMAWAVAFARKVLREMEKLGESPEEAVNLFVAMIRILFDETVKKIKLNHRSNNHPSPSQ